MQVLHGLSLPGEGFALWAEDSEIAVKAPSQALRSARPHPFAAAPQVLLKLGRGTVAERVLELPSLRSAPLDSPELIRITPRPAARSTPMLLPWTVPVLVVSATDAAAVLLGAAAGPDAAPDPDGEADSGPSAEDGAEYPAARPIDELRRGASMAHLRLIAEYAAALVDRGRVLPTLVRNGDDAAARWRPVLQGGDVVAVHALVTAMPPVARATPGANDAHELTMAALGAFVDTLARERAVVAVGSGSLLPRRPGRPPRRLPAADAWIAALTDADGSLGRAAGMGTTQSIDPADIDALATALAPWDEVGRGAAGPARATFRLRAALDDAARAADDDASAEGEAASAGHDAVPGEAHAASGSAAPADDGDAFTDIGQSAWRVDFLLQSSQDPSLLVDAAQAWDDDGSLGRWLPRPQELLLAELGRASRVYPDLTPGLRSARPTALELDADGAYEFLLTAAPALEEAGFGVLLPSWWDRRATLGLTLSAQTPTDGVVAKDKKFGKEQLVAFQWSLAVGDQTLSEAEIAALAAAKAPLIRLRGQWVTIDQDQLQRGLAFIKGTGKKRSRKRMTAAEILALAASHPDDAQTPLPITDVRADGWLGDLLRGELAQSVQPITPPPGLHAELRPYQQRGLSWLAFLSKVGLGACLADDMGLGKTVQLLALEVAERGVDPELPPTLLLCPMSLMGNWQREAAKFAPDLRIYVHHGGSRLSGEQLTERLGVIDMVVTTYATATRDMDELAEITWCRVVLDEAQAIKNALSRSAKAVKRLTADHTVALTGTPVENRLAELWSIMDFLNPGLLGSPELFRTRYAIPVERYGHTEPAERLRAVTRPYVLRRLKTDPTIIDDLPEKIEVKQYCRLTTEQASLYQSVVDDMMEKIEGSEGIARRGRVLAAMAKLKQVCNHPALLLHDRSAIGARSGKVALLEELLGEILDAGEKVLCFTQFTEYAQMLLPHLAGRFDTDIAYLHGGTSKKRRDELVAAFQTDAGPPIFLLSLKAGGTGLNLTAANHVIHLDRWWNPAVEDQATDRAFRIGQHRNVQVRKFICTGTLEERIDEMLEEKKALADLVIRDGEGWLTELSTGDLRDVFALSKDAVDA